MLKLTVEQDECIQLMEPAEYEAQIAVLERENRILKKKLARSEMNRVLLEEALSNHTAAIKIYDREKMSERLNQILDLLPTPIIEIDKNGIIKMINTAFLSYHSNDLKKADFLEKPFPDIVGVMNSVFGETDITQVLKGTVINQKHAKGAHANWLISAIPITGETEELSGGLAIYQNITEYEKIRVEMAKLDRLNLIAEMAAGVAHEIRNPLTVIKGYLQFLQRKIPDSVKEQFQIILTEVSCIEAIISNFLSLAKNTLSQKEISNLNEIIMDILPLIHAEANRCNIFIKLNLADQLPDQLLDGKEIKQVILNLCRNAFEAMSQQGVLSLQTKVIDTTVVCVVSDTGCGIPQDKLNKIFNPFYTTKENGTGLGISICENIVKKHDGEIEVDSQENEGTKVTIRLPA